VPDGVLDDARIASDAPRTRCRRSSFKVVRLTISTREITISRASITISARTTRPSRRRPTSSEEIVITPEILGVEREVAPRGRPRQSEDIARHFGPLR
jgi:hypothetical protein